MSDLKQYIKNRKQTDKSFAKDYEAGYAEFKIGVVLRELRQEAGLTQEDIAIALHTQKSAISRIENQAEDIRLSTLFKFAKILGKHVNISFA